MKGQRIKNHQVKFMWLSITKHNLHQRALQFVQHATPVRRPPKNILMGNKMDETSVGETILWEP